MRKYLIFLFSLSLLFAVASCGGGEENDPPVTPTPQQPGGSSGGGDSGSSGGDDSQGGGGDQNGDDNDGDDNDGGGGDDENPASDDPYFNIELSSPYTLSHVGTESMEAYVYVTTNVVGWTCRADQPWCTVRCDDHNIYFIIPTYYGYDDRQVTMTISHEGKDYASLTIIQQADAAFSFVFPDGQAMPAQGGSITVEVYTNSDTWTVAVPGDSWLTATKTSSTTVQLTAPARQGSTPRPDQEIYINATRGAGSFFIKDGSSGNEGYGYDGDNTGWD